MSFLDSFLPGIVNTLSDTSFLGANCEASVSVSSSYDYATGEDVETTVKDDLVCFPPMEYAQNKIDGTNIKRGDMMLIIAQERWAKLSSSFGSKPTTQMSITIRGSKYSVENVGSYSTGELDAAYELQLRLV